MSDFLEKLEQRRTEAGRARQGYVQHMKRYELQSVRYVGEDYKPALEVLAFSVESQKGKRVLEVVAIHSMPQVSIWSRTSGSADEEWFEHVATLDAEWDVDARAWRLLGINKTESMGWPALAPRCMDLGILHRGEHHVEQPAAVPVHVHVFPPATVQRRGRTSRKR